MSYEICFFARDEKKASKSYKTHHIHFIDATTIFNDLTRYEEFDESHSTTEERFKTIGTAIINSVPTIITVVYTVRHDTIRIITAWKSTAEEVKKYNQR